MLAAGLVPLAVFGSLVIGIVLLVFCNRKAAGKPFIAVVSCEDSAAEARVTELINKSVSKAVIKSKSAQKGCIELNWEVFLKDGDTAFVTALSEVEGVHNAVLVSYNGDYLG